MGKSSMRDLVMAAGGALHPSENRKAWFARIAEAAGVSIRVVRAAWHQEQLSEATAQKLKKAAERNEPSNHAAHLDGLAELLRAKDAAFYQPQIDQLRDLARQLRSDNRAAG